MQIYNLAFLLLLPCLFTSPAGDSQQKLKKAKLEAAKIIFKSADGGQTWQDISEGLPENLKADAIQRDGFFANETGLYLRTSEGIFHSKSNSAAPFWTKEVFPDKQGSIAPGKKENEVRTVSETAQNSVFVGSNNGMVKSNNDGTDSTQARPGGGVMKVVESGGVLMATSQGGIIRSTDKGENWESVISEGGVGIAIERIKGGFAAITFNTASSTRRMRTTYDGGKTWQTIDAGLPPNLSITSIIEVGDNFFCGHPAGIFRSSDKGKTWKLLLPSIDNKAFNLFVSGNVIYAVQGNGGC